MVLITHRKHKSRLQDLKELGLDKKPVCMAKTQYSLSDNAKLLGRPENFEITVSKRKNFKRCGIYRC